MPDQAAALPADVGLCVCTARNSLRATRCHACGATLPWVKPKAEPKPKVAKTTKLASPLNANVNLSIGSETAVVWGVGSVVFIISLLFPFIGLWLYRFFSSDESPLANFAAAGGLAGLALWIWVGMGNAVNKPEETAGTVP